MVHQPIVEVRDLRKTFAVKHAGAVSTLHALSGVNFEIMRGETLGLVGESGSGKTTTGRILVGLIPASSGSVRLFGADITGADGKKQLADVRAKLQLVFRIPMLHSIRACASAAPPPSRWTSPAAGPERTATTALPNCLSWSACLKPVSSAIRANSPAASASVSSLPALALNPYFVVCNEPVSAPDVSMQAQIVNLLLELQERLGLSRLFIAHDLAVVRAVSTRVAVVYARSIDGTAPKAMIYSDPKHPYSRALLDAVQRADPDFVRHPVVPGEVPSLLGPPPGCSFHPRCAYAMKQCGVELPLLKESGSGRGVACHLFST